MLPSFWIIPFDAQPGARLVCYRPDVSHCTELALKTEALSGTVLWFVHWMKRSLLFGGLGITTKVRQGQATLKLRLLWDCCRSGHGGPHRVASCER